MFEISAITIETAAQVMCVIDISRRGNVGYEMQYNHCASWRMKLTGASIGG
jgi:hypothetical protein